MINKTNNTDKITHIYHLADIHLRNLQRHKEYREVFDKFLKQVIEDNIESSIIYIAGDIAHAKTEMSPELVREISWFLNECSKLKETFLITGNHDCFMGDHEILTQSGWIRLDEYINNSYNHKVATFNTENSEIEFQLPITNIKNKFTGELINLQGKDISQIVTPNHNILHTYSSCKGNFYKKKAIDISQNTNIPINGIINNHIDNKYAELLGFSLADGTFIEKHKLNNTWCIQFHLKKERKIQYLSNLLSDLNYEHNICSQKDGTTYIRIYSQLAKDIGTFFEGKKIIPNSILMKDKSFIKSFIDGYINGDGSNSKNEFYRFGNINQDNIKFIVTLARLCGYKSRISKNGQGNYENSKILYGGNLNKTNRVNNSTVKTITKVQYDGFVYCLSVPNTNLLIRHNDKISISGNCNLNNNYRLDVLTPIIENINNPRIHYLRDTGTYEHKNITFVVYSILDHKDNWPSGYNVNGENIICLFHGPVNKAETDIGYIVSSNSFTVDMFDGHHIAMLGDIHRRQELQTYSDEYMEIDEDDLQIYLDKGWVKDI